MLQLQLMCIPTLCTSQVLIGSHTDPGIFAEIYTKLSQLVMQQNTTKGMSNEYDQV